MFRLKRTDIPGVPDAVRVTVELADDTPAGRELSPDAISAAALGPQPLTDAGIIAQQGRQLESYGRTIAMLQAQLAEYEKRPACAPGDCKNCPGYRTVITGLKAERAENRRTIARLQLAAPTARQQRLLPFPPSPASSEPGL